MKFVTALLCVLIGTFVMGPLGAILGFLIWYVLTQTSKK